VTGQAVLAPQAQRELRASVQRIAADNPMAARRLRDAVQAAAELVGTKPLTGHVRLDLAPSRYRFWSLPAFSLLLAYDTTTDPIRILRIVHTMRDLPPLLANLFD
jgi:toxin ParE1/3/4